jgi:tetratricopeptide (TPR) repeat protein
MSETPMNPQAAGGGTLDAAEWFRTGRAAETGGDWEAAKSAYLRVVDLDDDHANVLYRLGCVCLKAGQVPEAEHWFQRGLAQHPADGNLLTNLGVTLDRLGRREDAVHAYQKAIFHDDASAETYNNLGAIYAEEGRIEDATRAFEAAIAREPDAEGYHNLGLLHLAQGDPAAAFDCFERAVAHDASFTRGHYYAAVCLQKQGRYRESIARFDLVLAQDQRLVRAHYYRGTCLHKLERFAEALTALSLAEKAIPEDGRLQYQLALTNDALGHTQAARRHYRLARLARENG